MYLTLILVFFISCIIECIPIFQKKMWKELTIIIALNIIGISLAALKAIGIISPIKALEELLYPLGKMVFRNHI